MLQDPLRNINSCIRGRKQLSDSMLLLLPVCLFFVFVSKNSAKSLPRSHLSFKQCEHHVGELSSGISLFSHSNYLFITVTDWYFKQAQVCSAFWNAIEFDVSDRVTEKYPLVPKLEWFLGPCCLLLCPPCVGRALLAPGPGLSVRLMYRSTGYKWNLSQQG